MSNQLSRAAERVFLRLKAKGFNLVVHEMPDSTQTASDAARSIGCQVAQIAKSLVFLGVESGSPLLIIVSGAHRVNEDRIAGIVGEPVKKADAAFIRAHTGFSIGGIPPAGHDEPIKTLIDQELSQHSHIWAAAGTPHAVFRLSFRELESLTDGEVVSVI